jgi:hypothetical protein
MASSASTARCCGALTDGASSSFPGPETDGDSPSKCTQDERRQGRKTRRNGLHWQQVLREVRKLALWCFQTGLARPDPCCRLLLRPVTMSTLDGTDGWTTDR